ncbi:MAG: hypothetical protein AAGA60_23660 [Cyanobacteria bacterium P01_E01_bin.42]
MQITRLNPNPLVGYAEEISASLDLKTAPSNEARTVREAQEGEDVKNPFSAAPDDW